MRRRTHAKRKKELEAQRKPSYLDELIRIEV